jgi:hypothetical protein
MMLHIRLYYCLITVQVLVMEPVLSYWMRQALLLLPPMSIRAWGMQQHRAPRHLRRLLPAHPARRRPRGHPLLGRLRPLRRPRVLLLLGRRRL